jgi:hypothetical protein
MDRTLVVLLTLSAVLISFVAPLATLMLVSIVTLSAFSTWGSWIFVRGLGDNRQPEAQRVWD